MNWTRDDTRACRALHQPTVPPRIPLNSCVWRIVLSLTGACVWVKPAVHLKTSTWRWRHQFTPKKSADKKLNFFERGHGLLGSFLIFNNKFVRVYFSFDFGRRLNFKLLDTWYLTSCVFSCLVLLCIVTCKGLQIFCSFCCLLCMYNIQPLIIPAWEYNSCFIWCRCKRALKSPPTYIPWWQINPFLFARPQYQGTILKRMLWSILHV